LTPILSYTKAQIDWQWLCLNSRHFDFRDNGKKLGDKQEYAGESDDGAELSETLRDLTVTKMDADEEKIYQMFQKYDANMVASNQQQPSVFSSGTGITVAKIDRTKHVDTPSMKGMQGTPLSSAVQVADKRQSVIALGKKTSVLDLPPNDHGSRGMAMHVDDSVSNTSSAARVCDHNVCADEQQPPLINEVRHKFIIFACQCTFYLFPLFPFRVTLR